VLSRLGTAIDMSKDHKPNRPDEKARIEQAGGHVSGKGIPRVSGLLATSRTFGDGSMKAPNVKRVCIIAEPEVTVWDVRAPLPLVRIVSGTECGGVANSDLSWG
jgi:serine/threonine protein phosphatase PrpC